MRKAIDGVLILSVLLLIAAGCSESASAPKKAASPGQSKPMAAAKAEAPRSAGGMRGADEAAPGAVAGSAPTAESPAMARDVGRADAAAYGRTEMAKESAAPRSSPPPKPSLAPAADEKAKRYAAETKSDSPARPVERLREKPQLQSGLLTAGSLDDHDRYDEYQRFLSNVQQNDPQEKLPRLDVGQRAVIVVENEQGLPVPDARVVVRPENSQQPGQGETLLEVTTASDGRALFLSGMDHAAGRARFRVSVTADGKPPVDEVMDLSQSTWRIRLPGSEARHVRRLDLALVIDTTGSMGDELEYLKVEIDNIAQAIHTMFPDVDQRYALIVYRDQGDQYVTRTFDFTGSLEEFRSNLSAQSAAGGGDYPEAVHLALEQTGKLSWRKDGTARVVFLVADAPPHEEFNRRTLEAVAGLRRQTIRLYPVGGSGVAAQAEFVFRAAAFLTQGQYLFLTDHSGVGNPHAPPQTSEFLVERLDRLMLRMVASELSGRKLVPTEVIAIEGGRSPYDRTPPVPTGQEQTSQRPQPIVPRPTQTSHRPLSAVEAAWQSLPEPRLSWLTHWSVLASVLIGKLVFDCASDRRRRARDYPPPDDATHVDS
jgi:hypothetical protein